jgi:uncharacterized YkwD family protein
MFKKKAILSVAAAAALLMSSPALNKAEAAGTETNVQQKVYYQTGYFNVNEINNLLQNYFLKFGYQVKQPVQTPTYQAPKATETPTYQPVQTAPQPVSQPQTETVQPKTEQDTSTLSAYEQKVVDLTNQERAKNGLAALKVDTTLSKLAREKSRDMSVNGYFSHTSPTYGSPFDMMKQYGITYRAAGENIAMGQRTPEEVVQAWMNSEGHRKNILSSNFTHIGVGYVASGNYWTQEFIGK